ncbi:hypothetical protein PGTUg99_031158 [Puccinia graminis f. sp. tritici]|uniref:Uncharacterized protein n=1 Tax=Puccinia graminis f. sp. tritici TaxID=56615 RepID=A0A5B0MDJ7_PUCGR|nr:hypothetical protein PGTUg99_031158 [Puccinia graminis f. sp. tritici]
MRRILFIACVFLALMESTYTVATLWPPTPRSGDDQRRPNTRIKGTSQSQSFGGSSFGSVGLAGACDHDPFGGLSASNIRSLGLRFGARSLLYTNGYRFGLAMIF